MHPIRRMTCPMLGVALALVFVAPPSARAGNAPSKAGSTAILHPEMVLQVYEKPHAGSGLARALSFDFLVSGDCFFPCQTDVPGTEDYLFDLTPSTAVNPKALTAYVAWSRQNPVRLDYDIAIAAFSTTAWVASQIVVNAPGDDLNPRIAVGPDGNVHLVYESGGEIGYREFTGGLSLIWSQSVSKDLKTVSNHAPRVAVDPDGFAWVVYLGDAGTGEQVLFAAQNLANHGPGGVNTAISPLRVAELTRITPPSPQGWTVTLSPPTVELVSSVPLAYWVATDSGSGASVLQFVHRNVDSSTSDVGRLRLAELSVDQATSLARDFVRTYIDSLRYTPPGQPGDSSTIGIGIDPQTLPGGSQDVHGGDR